jgi:AcrR family transcriptional regulator
MSGPLPPAEGRRAGLRERKKQRTRLAIQEHALRLFREQGYSRTTVEQIAEAAEVSPSTFFRYFPTKEDVVLFDALDPVLFDAFRRQPAELPPVQALRRTLREVFDALSPEQLAEQRERGVLVFGEPDLQAAWIVDVVRTSQAMAQALGERTRLPPDDRRIAVFTGAVMGAIMAAMIPMLRDPGADFVADIEAALNFLEEGLPL